ncbi:fumarylacetoacetate hydrolase family protein [Cryobacterium tepidiphilum]|uniref:FAA hydrolase family protein n=1 Tax=Cryobacterium tepidiphilum TaxID=2486026 RepID=A0A3M8L1C4_9MICO|nr:fumarylacetoacetate hydrolase family protein [Cryobacterium tepidiphilum]RNE59313.1 FAA hydrolase family protein [Cryobacterium tepidiphilum]
MKIARFSHDGAIAFGVVDDDDLVVLQGDPMFAGYEPTGERVPLADAKLLAPVIPRSKVVVLEDADDDGFLFTLKPNTTVIGPGDAIVLPAQSDDVVAHGELAAVIGRIAKNVTAADAGGVIFGYTVANNVLARDLQEEDAQSSRAMSFDSFCPLGPVIETELAAAPEVEGSVGGRVFQSGDAEQAMQRINAAVAFLSGIFTLLPGDVIVAGASGDEGALADGDTVTVEIAGVGALANPVRKA